MTAPVISASALTRRFGAITAVDGMDLAIGSGERIALVGHNGAGKTTLIKLILGLLPPTSGTLDVLGGAPGSLAARRASAYLPENLAFHGSLTGREQLAFFARLKGVDDQARELAARVGLEEALERRIATYSKGMRQRLGLAQLLLGRPRLVILDEPTSGLDPVSRHRFYEIVSELAADGATVIQSSHVLTELEARTDRIVILRNGRIAADGDLATLRREADLPIRIRVQAHAGRKERLLEKLGGEARNGKVVELEVSRAQKMERISAIGRNARDIDDFDIIEPSLEDLYLHFGNSAGQRGEPR